MRELIPTIEKLSTAYANIHDNFVKAYYSYSLYLTLEKSSASNIVGNEQAEKNVSVINHYWWILGQNVSNFYKEYAIIKLYSVYEKKNDIDNIYKLLDDIEKNISIVSVNFSKNFLDENEKVTHDKIEKIRGKIHGKIENDLRNFRVLIAHCFTDERSSEKKFSINNAELEEIFENTKDILNEIRVILHISNYEYSEFNTQCQNDFKNMFNDLYNHSKNS